ncbi:MAG: type II toxin-antitoxin system PemK/MazF family toxin [Dehalococcoidia bacterium]
MRGVTTRPKMQPGMLTRPKIGVLPTLTQQSASMTEPGPNRGQIWQINLAPTAGSEIAKTRPALVINADDFGHLPVRIVVPLTTWQPRFERQRNKLFVSRSDANGLQNDSAAEVLQVRTASLLRFDRKLGTLSSSEVETVVAALHTATSGSAR